MKSSARWLGALVLLVLVWAVLYPNLFVLRDSIAGADGLTLAHYRRFAELVAPLGFEIARLELSARQAWRLQLVGKDDARLTVMLGRDQTPNDALNRLRRFVALYPHALAQLGGNVGHVDLRYPNGFALRVPGLEQFETQHKKAGSV